MFPATNYTGKSLRPERANAFSLPTDYDPYQTQHPQKE